VYSLVEIKSTLNCSASCFEF